MSTILIVEDEEDLRRGLQVNLAREGYAVVTAASAREAMQRVLEESPDLVVLDVMLPGTDGFDLCRDLRQHGLGAPIVMLTARSDVADRVVGLEAGADDYVTKPFSLPELLARIRARLRRQPSSATESLRSYAVAGIEIDFHGLTLRRGERDFHLTPKECEVLRVLVLRRGQVVTRTYLLREIWHYDSESTTRTVDTHIMTLRQKLEENAANPRHILTIYGEGYKFVD